jgi:two-component system, OmpR family, alkaline phosphatase synthesis response regulator PhoP
MARILIVDDDEPFAQSNRDLFEAYGHEVFTATDGATGIRTAREVKPDAMILDVMMATDTEGFDVARKIPEIPELRNMAVLLVTGVTTALHLPGELTPDDSWLPVERVLEKPILPDRLLKEVEKVLAKKRGG